MCFLFGGLRFREQVCEASCESRSKTKKVADLQQYCHANERMSTLLKRYEPTFAGKPPK